MAAGWNHSGTRPPAPAPVPVPVPEIDGNALFKALFCLFTLAVGLQVRRRRAPG